MIQDWRTRWGTNFPFAWVQLPEFGTPLRPNQSRMSLGADSRKNAAEPSGRTQYGHDRSRSSWGETKNAHPKNKTTGYQLAAGFLWALADVYGRKNVAG